MKAKLILLFLFAGTIAWSQVTIKGQVKDASNETLPGVSISVTGTSIGTITDIDGSYEISVPADAKELQFSFIGYEPILN